MYIIIAGGGEVGYYLAKVLLGGGHEVLVIEKQRARCEFISEELGSVVMRGDCCEARTHAEIGTGRADILIAVTGDDEDNLVVCQVAKHKFAVPRTIARAKNPRHSALFSKLGIDVTVSSTELILSHIEQELPPNPLIPLIRLSGGDYVVIDAKIPPDSKLIGKRVGEFRLPGSSLVVMVVGKNKSPQIPTPNTIIEAADELVAITESGNEEKIRALLAGIQV